MRQHAAFQHIGFNSKRWLVTHRSRRTLNEPYFPHTKIKIAVQFAKKNIIAHQKNMGFFDIGHYNCLSLEKRHYNSPIRRSTIIISSLTHPCHFLRLSRIRAHFQIVYLQRWIRTSNSQTTPLNGAGAGAPPRHCCRPWRRRRRACSSLQCSTPAPPSLLRVPPLQAIAAPITHPAGEPPPPPSTRTG